MGRYASITWVVAVVWSCTLASCNDDGGGCIVYPEQCNGVDDNCNGLVDEGNVCVSSCPIAGDYLVALVETDGDCGFETESYVLSFPAGEPNCDDIVAGLTAGGALVSGCAYDPSTCCLSLGYYYEVPETADTYGLQIQTAIAYCDFDESGFEGGEQRDVVLTESGVEVGTCTSILTLTGNRQ